jgi:hypothetical protein
MLSSSWERGEPIKHLMGSQFTRCLCESRDGTAFWSLPPPPNLYIAMLHNGVMLRVKHFG